jgi:hypothetical protein
MELVTTECSEHDHPEVVITFDDTGIPEETGRVLVRTIEQMVAEGSVFRPGESFAIGWMIAEIAEAGEGRLTLREPDLDTAPLEYRDGVTETLRHKMIQVFSGDSYGIERDRLVIPTINQLAIACEKVPESSALLLARNDSSDPDDSGWFALCTDEDHDHEDTGNIGVVPLHELARVRPEIIAWMMFPTGTTLLLEPEEAPLVMLDDVALELVEGSFVDQMLRHQGISVDRTS